MVFRMYVKAIYKYVAVGRSIQVKLSRLSLSAEWNIQLVINVHQEGQDIGAPRQVVKEHI